MRDFSPTSFGQLARFVAVGGANTLATGAIFMVLTSWLAVAAAYTIAFVLGVAFAVTVTPRVVFSARTSRRGRGLYGAWYLAIYLVGLLIVYFVHDILGLDRPGVVAVTAPATAVLGFLGARRLFREAQEE